ncbi:Imm61 family immunity protein [Agromyces sp. LHK192]|uniref:Imm61 family immunity protein n=1 Tax=Agromyces sp. LHK192 TaxID=2498704 RepID=UPI000FDB56F0|nr:Imm61 family immunity protein [Agromyces sp. LHK192]
MTTNEPGSIGSADDRDAALLAFAASGRIAPFPVAGALLCLGDMEVRFEIVARDGEYDLLRQERSGPKRLVLSSSELATVRKALVVRIAVNVRARRGQRRVAGPAGSASLADGFELAEHPAGDDLPARVELRWTASDGGAASATFPAQPDGHGAAIRLSRYVLATESELIESLSDPSGRPLFTVA